MAPEVRIEQVSEPLTTEWDDLADRLAAPPHLRPGWFAAWARVFGNGELELIVVRQGGRLAGALPLVRRRGVLRAPANYHSPGFEALAEDPQALAALCERALSHASRRVSLPLIDQDGSFATALGAAATATGCRVLTRTMQRTPVVAFEGDWERYLGTLSRGFRKELRRYRRRLEEMGAVELEVSDGSDGLERRVEEVFAVEGSGWKAEGGTAIRSRPETLDFYKEIADWASHRGMLRLLVLRLDGEAIAVDYALESGGVRYMLKGGLDPHYARVAPGTLLLEAGLRHGFEAGLSTVELGGRDDAYKVRWSSSTRDRLLLQAFRRTPLGDADWAAFAVGRPLMKRVLRTLENTP